MKINTKILALVLLAFITINKISAQKKGEKQNIIFLLTDDQRWDALSCMGNKEISTPNIDKIGEKGVIFTNFYNTTSICMASRAQMMTGMYEFKTEEVSAPTVAAVQTSIHLMLRSTTCTCYKQDKLVD